MDPYIPLLSALAGALIGAAASVAAIIVQAHYQNKREMTKEALALALADWKTRLELVKERGGAALPMAAFVHYHTRLIHLAQSGNVTPATIKQLSAEQEEILKALKEVKDEHSKRRDA